MKALFVYVLITNRFIFKKSFSQNHLKEAKFYFLTLDSVILSSRKVRKKNKYP